MNISSLAMQQKLNHVNSQIFRVGISNECQYLSLSFVCSQRVNPFLQNLIDFVWHLVPKPVHCLGNRIREEAIASKESLNSWLKSFAVHTKLGDKKNV